MVFGRKPEASDEDTGPLEHPKPPLPAEDGRFRQVTDVAWDKAGNTFISDGYSIRAWRRSTRKATGKSWGDRGKDAGPVQHPRQIATDAHGNVYVADRGNHRIQVFDGDGKFLRQFTINVPVPPDAKPAIGKIPDEAMMAGRHFYAGLAVVNLHHAAAQPGALQLRRLARPHLQAQPRRQGAGRARPVRQAVETIRLDPCHGVPVSEHALCGGTSELAGAEADLEAVRLRRHRRD